MKIITGTTDLHMAEACAIAIGKFDGIHLGHMQIINSLLKQKELGLKTVIFSFDISPNALFAKDGEHFTDIYAREEKIKLFEAVGIDYLIEFPLNITSSRMPAEEFVTEILMKQLQVKYIVAGMDVKFGYQGQGNANLLNEFQAKGAFVVELHEKMKMEETGAEISSTVIRSFLRKGQLAKANELLNRTFSLVGIVVKGNQLGGSVFQMPTANVVWPNHKITLPFGVYYTVAKVKGHLIMGLTNVGVKPTIEENSAVLAETYLYQFNDDIYGEEVEVFFYEFKREECKFENFDALKKQLIQDMEDGKRFWFYTS